MFDRMSTAIRYFINDILIYNKIMNITNKIKELRDARGWSTNQLALEAELTQSTVSTLLTKPNSLPSLDTLARLCNAFGMTLAQFFMEEEENELVNAQEKLLIEQYRKLPEKKKEAVIALLSE